MRELPCNDDKDKVVQLLKKIDRFSAFSDSDLKSLTGMVKLREYKAGEILIKEGEFDCWVYFLIYGLLEIVKDGKVIKDRKIVSTLKRNGDLFGEMGVIDGSPRSASIRAIKDSLVIGLDASLIDRKIKTNETVFCYTIYRIFAEVLAARLRIMTEDNIRLKERIISLTQVNAPYYGPDR